MKKNLLLAAAAAFVAFGASAAAEVCFINAEPFNLGESPTLDDNTVLAETENVTFYYYHADQASAQNSDFNGCKEIVVNGEVIKIVPGIGGNTNGVCNLNDGPSTGCMYRFNVKKDGWLMVPSKISSNKNFYAYEGLVGNDPQPVAYTLGMDLQSGDYPEINSINYTLPGDDLGYIDMNAANIGDYTFGGTTIAWPIRIATGNPDAASAGNGTGIIMFPVYADAADYLVFATGSKMNTCGAIFVEGEEMPSVGIVYGRAEGDDGYLEGHKSTVVAGDPFAGVAQVAVDAVANENAPVYNIYGQRVSKDTKGLLIQNGVKFYNR